MLSGVSSITDASINQHQLSYDQRSMQQLQHLRQQWQQAHRQQHLSDPTIGTVENVGISARPQPMSHYDSPMTANRTTIDSLPQTAVPITPQDAAFVASATAQSPKPSPLERCLSVPPSPTVSLPQVATPPHLDRSHSLPEWSTPTALHQPTSLLGIDYYADFLDSPNSPPEFLPVNLLRRQQLGFRGGRGGRLNSGNGAGNGAGNGGPVLAPPSSASYPVQYMETSSSVESTSNSESVPSMPGSIMSDLSESLVALDLAEPRQKTDS